MRIVCISDTHCQHWGLSLPEGDMIIHCGDITGRGGEKSTVDFLNWYSRLPFKYKILIAGNHDMLFYFDIQTSKKLLSRYPNVIYLENTGIEIEGIKFWGFPYTTPFHQWAFMLKREQMRMALKLIPKDIDVLITHGPPYEILDQVDYTDRNDYDPVRDKHTGEHTGCKDLLNTIKEIKPKYHIFGHIHEEYGVFESKSVFLDKTTFINASILDGAYKRVNKPIVIEI